MHLPFGEEILVKLQSLEEENPCQSRGNVEVLVSEAIGRMRDLKNKVQMCVACQMVRNGGKYEVLNVNIHLDHYTPHPTSDERPHGARTISELLLKLPP